MAPTSRAGRRDRCVVLRGAATGNARCRARGRRRRRDVWRTAFASSFQDTLTGGAGTAVGSTASSGSGSSIGVSGTEREAHRGDEHLVEERRGQQPTEHHRRRGVGELVAGDVADRDERDQRRRADEHRRQRRPEPIAPRPRVTIAGGQRAAVTCLQAADMRDLEHPLARREHEHREQTDVCAERPHLADDERRPAARR